MNVIEADDIIFIAATHVETVVLLSRKNIEDSEIFQPKEKTSETVVLITKKRKDSEI